MTLLDVLLLQLLHRLLAVLLWRSRLGGCLVEGDGGGRGRNRRWGEVLPTTEVRE
jgi:hypothetical protein